MKERRCSNCGNRIICKFYTDIGVASLSYSLTILDGNGSSFEKYLDKVAQYCTFYDNKEEGDKYGEF